MEGIKHILTEYNQQLEEWRQKYDTLEFIENKDYQPFIEEPERLEQLEILLVGDNPGKKEKKNQEYFSPEGMAGRQMDKFSKAMFGEDYRHRKLLVLNKTPIHTPVTHQLKKVDNQPLDETQIYMAEMIKKLSEKLEIPVWIVGLGYYKKGKMFHKFFSRLNNGEARVLMTPHFSMSSLFQSRAYRSFTGENPIKVFADKYPEYANDKGNIVLNQLIKGNDVELFFNEVVCQVEYEKWL